MLTSTNIFKTKLFENNIKCHIRDPSGLSVGRSLEWLFLGTFYQVSYGRTYYIKYSNLLYQVELNLLHILADLWTTICVESFVVNSISTLRSWTSQTLCTCCCRIDYVLLFDDKRRTLQRKILGPSSKSSPFKNSLQWLILHAMMYSVLHDCRIQDSGGKHLNADWWTDVSFISAILWFLTKDFLSSIVIELCLIMVWLRDAVLKIFCPDFALRLTRRSSTKSSEYGSVRIWKIDRF